MARKLAPDKWLFAATIGLALFGVVMVYSASAVLAQKENGNQFHYVLKQGVWVFVGFIVMLLNWIAPEKLFNFLMNSSGALMMFTYTFVALAHYKFPYSRPGLRTAGGAQWIAGAAALAMVAVMLAMAFMPNKQPEMQASLACLAVIVIALFIKRALARPV